MNEYAHYQALLSITFNEAIYWLMPACYAEQHVHMRVLDDSAFDVRTYVQESLRVAGAREVARQPDGWLRYTTVASERTEGDTVIFRHTLYEQPGYRELKLLRVPLEWMTFRQMDDQHNVIDLPLRRLMYHGGTVRAALHDDVLHVVLRD